MQSKAWGGDRVKSLRSGGSDGFSAVKDDYSLFWLGENVGIYTELPSLRITFYRFPVMLENHLMTMVVPNPSILDLPILVVLAAPAILGLHIIYSGYLFSSLP